MNTPQSIVLVTVDCLRADHVGFLGYERPTTPALDSVAGESLIFRNAIAAGIPTYYSFPAIMASRYPQALGRDVVGLAPAEPTLASTLKEAGYTTAAFVAGNPYLSGRFGYAAGFEKFEDFLAAENVPSRPAVVQQPGALSRMNSALAEWSHRLGPLGALYNELYFRYGMWRISRTESTVDELRPYPTAEVVVDQACRWLETAAGRPFFLWLHLMDAHLPFYPSETAQAALGLELIPASRMRYLNAIWNRKDIRPARLRPYREEMLRLYDCSVRWVDTQLARLVAALRTHGVWDGCVFALTADHGEEFLEHGNRFHSAANLHDELIRVPLLVRIPAHVMPGFDGPFSLVHLPATLLDAVNLPCPMEFRGRSFLAKMRNGGSWTDSAITEGLSRATNPPRVESQLHPRVLAVRETRHKLVFDFEGRRESLFDLENDPGELCPLPAGSERTVRRRLLEQARDHLEKCARYQNPAARLGLLLDNLSFSGQRPS
jgi:arylsulfatase A-like enzyme